MRNLNGKTLEDWLQYQNPSLSNITSRTPTFPRSSSYLDHFLISNHLLNSFDQNFSVQTLPTFSDHFPLLLNINIVDANLCLQVTAPSKSFKNTNWDSFREDLDISLMDRQPPHTCSLSNSQIDNYIVLFNDTLCGTLDRHSSFFRPSSKKYKNLPKNIEQLFKIKHHWQRQLKNIFHSSYNRINSPYRELSTRISLLNKIIQDKVRAWLNTQLSDRLSKIHPGPRVFKKV